MLGDWKVWWEPSAPEAPQNLPILTPLLVPWTGQEFVPGSHSHLYFLLGLESFWTLERIPVYSSTATPQHLKNLGDFSPLP